jgi:hypothetical protein
MGKVNQNKRWAYLIRFWQKNEAWKYDSGAIMTATTIHAGCGHTDIDHFSISDRWVWVIEVRSEQKLDATSEA